MAELNLTDLATLARLMKECGGGDVGLQEYADIDANLEIEDSTLEMSEIVKGVNGPDGDDEEDGEGEEQITDNAMDSNRNIS